jgi:hypothetical protein
LSRRKRVAQTSVLEAGWRPDGSGRSRAASATRHSRASGNPGWMPASADITVQFTGREYSALRQIADIKQQCLRQPPWLRASRVGRKIKTEIADERRQATREAGTTPCADLFGDCTCLAWNHPAPQGVRIELEFFTADCSCWGSSSWAFGGMDLEEKVQSTLKRAARTADFAVRGSSLATMLTGGVCLRRLEATSSFACQSIFLHHGAPAAATRHVFKYPERAE